MRELFIGKRGSEKTGRPEEAVASIIARNSLLAGGFSWQERPRTGLIVPGSFVENKVIGGRPFRPVRDREKMHYVPAVLVSTVRRARIVRISTGGTL